MDKDKNKRDADLSSEQAVIEALDKELNMILYAVSHDLRAPIRTIDGFSQAVVEDYSAVLDETGRDFLARVRRGCAALNAMIDDLLTMSRATREEMRPAEVDISALAGRILEELEASEPEREAEIVVEPGLSAWADPGMAALVLAKLLDNAWKFTAREPKAAIRLGRDPETGGFVLTDNGVGMDMAYAERRLFAPFQRMHHEKEFPGRGMGLATAMRIINRHGGYLRIDCAPGQGCKVEFAF